MSTPEIVVRVFAPPEWKAYRDFRLRALQEAPGAFAATYADSSTMTEREWEVRLANSPRETDLPLAAEVRGELAGMAWGKIEKSAPDLARLYQMWVAPEHRGCGVGRKILQEVIEWARSRGARRVELCVTCGDSPARRLYESAGFSPIDAPGPLRPSSDLMAQTMALDIR